MDIATWLRDLGLERYETAFREHEINVEILPSLTADDLKDIGVEAVGHRRKLLGAIAALAGPGEPVSESRTETKTRTEAKGPEAERRQLTVMFCDLVGSTELAARLDPEEMAQTVHAYHDRCTETLKAWGGHVAKYLGDGILVYFGYPEAHEDDGERSVRAGLEVTRVVGELRAPGGEALAARVGIATGLVMVGELIGQGEAQERAVIGETPNLAARLQELADPGSVVIAPETRRLLGDLFELAPLGPRPLKGFAKPVPLWRVAGESAAESRFEALHGARMTPLVGRDEELNLILSRWRQARDAAGQVVLVSGEPGIGKSRLVLALRERLQADPTSTLVYTGSPHHLNSAFHPFITQIEREVRFVPGESLETRVERIGALLRIGTAEADDAVALIADLLGISTERSRALAAISPLQRKDILFRAFLAQLESLARNGPLLIVLEDAHWLDPTSRELFDLVVERTQRLPALLVATFRPGFSPPWTGFSHVTLLTLNRLPQTQALSLIDRVTGGKALPDEVLKQILARTDGVPLFMEELTKAVLESELVRDEGERYVLDGPLRPLAIPTTLHDSLMARLDRLAAAKEVAQIGACIGREFGSELLAAVVSTPEPELEAALDRLVSAELVFRRGIPPAASYVFKHALVRDAAYESLLKKRRRELHGRIAMSIEAGFPQIQDSQPELVAQHFGEAGLHEKAIEYWLRAGQLATTRSANVEAISHLRAGLDGIPNLPSGRSRSKTELSLQLALGPPVLATKGFASSETEATYQRAQELSRSLGSEAELFTALRGLGYVHHVRADLRSALALVEETVTLAERSGDPVLLVEAHHFAGSVEFHFGEFQSARDRIAEGLAASHHRGRSPSEIYGINMAVFCRAYIGHCDWHLGYPDRALRTAREGLALAREIAHPFSIALALDYLAMLHSFRREPEDALAAAEEARGLCLEHRFDYYGAWSGLIRAWANAHIGNVGDGVAAYRAALQEFRLTGAGLRMPYYLSLLAALHRKAGEVAAGLRVVSEASTIANASQESWCNAELECERGELLLLAAPEDAHSKADAAFRSAIETAVAQKARLPELRARLARARLLSGSGDRQQARDVLAPVCGWFTEGFETADLEAAKDLLADLA